jgi:two-component system NtrC family sensor kinase
MTATPCRLAGVAISWTAGEDCPPLWGDEQQLKQVLLNLVLNSVNAQGDGGTVSLSARKEGARSVSISVADTGPGIPTELLERIFDPFFTTHPEGTGLGLSIVHRIVEGHGGRIDVETSERGTTFSVTLPAAPQEEKER